MYWLGLTWVTDSPVNGTLTPDRIRPKAFRLTPTTGAEKLTVTTPTGVVRGVVTGTNVAVGVPELTYSSKAPMSVVDPRMRG